jgi:hypothetical protein
VSVRIQLLSTSDRASHGHHQEWRFCRGWLLLLRPARAAQPCQQRQG